MIVTNIFEKFVTVRVVSHIPKFGDASKSPVRDTASPAGDAASPSEDAVVSHWRCISYFRDAHPPHSHPHLLWEMRLHLQITGYVTLLDRDVPVTGSRSRAVTNTNIGMCSVGLLTTDITDADPSLSTVTLL